MDEITGDFLKVDLYGFSAGTQLLHNRDEQRLTQFRFPNGRLFWLLDNQWEIRSMAMPEPELKAIGNSRPPAGTRVRVSLGDGEVVEWSSDVQGAIKVLVDPINGERLQRYEWTTNYSIL